jgi:hypothetical protein
MKKLLFSAVVLTLSCLSAFAFEVADNHTYNSSFWKNNVSVSVRPVYALTFGAEFDIAEHKNFDNHIYAVRLPVSLRSNEYGVIVKPFWYPDNANGAKAAGGKIMFVAGVNRDEISQMSSQAFVGAGFAAQKADLLKNGTVEQNKDFYQLAYEIGATYNFFNQYSFDISGNAYQYLSGIEGVDSYGGVMNQQELADLGTLDYVLALPKGSAGLKIKWFSSINNSENYISYKYIDFFTQDAVHSLMLGSNLRVSENVYFNIAYNHLFEQGSDKDIYGGGIMLRF